MTDLNKITIEGLLLSLGKYNEALEKQAGKPKLRSV